MRQGLYSGHKRALYFYEPISLKRLDSNARAFLNAVKPFDQVGNSRCINYLIKALKNNNIWNPNFVGLVFYGASPQSHVINLFNPNLVGYYNSTSNFQTNEKFLVNNADRYITFDNFNTDWINFQESYSSLNSLNNATAAVDIYESISKRLSGSINSGSISIRSYNDSNFGSLSIDMKFGNSLVFRHYNRENNNTLYTRVDDSEVSGNFTLGTSIPNNVILRFMASATAGGFISNGNFVITILANIKSNMSSTLRDIFLTYYELK